MTNQVGSRVWTDNRLTSRLGLRYPIIQGPLGGLSSQRLTAAVSNYGGLGSFDAHGLKPEAIRKVIRELKGLHIKAVCDEPVGLNGRRRSPHFDGRGIPSQPLSLAKHIEDVGGARPTYRPYEPIRFED
jgi:nitronate monooxygenase